MEARGSRRTRGAIVSDNLKVTDVEDCDPPLNPGMFLEPDPEDPGQIKLYVDVVLRNSSGAEVSLAELEGLMPKIPDDDAFAATIATIAAGFEHLSKEMLRGRI